MRVCTPAHDHQSIVVRSSIKVVHSFIHSHSPTHSLTVITHSIHYDYIQSSHRQNHLHHHNHNHHGVPLSHTHFTLHCVRPHVFFSVMCCMPLVDDVVMVIHVRIMYVCVSYVCGYMFRMRFPLHFYAKLLSISRYMPISHTNALLKLVCPSYLHSLIHSHSLFPHYFVPSLSLTLSISHLLPRIMHTLSVTSAHTNIASVCVQVRMV